MLMKTTVQSEHEAVSIAYLLIGRSKWFQVTPLADDEWEVLAKAEPMLPTGYTWESYSGRHMEFEGSNTVAAFLNCFPNMPVKVYGPLSQSLVTARVRYDHKLQVVIVYANGEPDTGHQSPP